MTMTQKLSKRYTPHYCPLNPLTGRGMTEADFEGSSIRAINLTEAKRIAQQKATKLDLILLNVRVSKEV